jgi:hypothetical protein
MFRHFSSAYNKISSSSTPTYSWTNLNRHATVFLDGQEYTEFDCDALARTISSITKEHLSKGALLAELSIVVAVFSEFSNPGYNDFMICDDAGFYSHLLSAPPASTSTSMVPKSIMCGKRWQPNNKAVVLQALMTECVFLALPNQQREMMANLCFDLAPRFKRLIDTSNQLKILNSVFVDTVVAFYQLECTGGNVVPVEIVLDLLDLLRHVPQLGIKFFKFDYELFDGIERVFASCARVYQKRRS